MEPHDPIFGIHYMKRRERNDYCVFVLRVCSDLFHILIDRYWTGFDPKGWWNWIAPFFSLRIRICKRCRFRPLLIFWNRRINVIFANVCFFSIERARSRKMSQNEYFIANIGFDTLRTSLLESGGRWWWCPLSAAFWAACPAACSGGC